MSGMPEVGTPAPSSSPTSSHVSTTEWQSFEVRMRRRRAERCLLRAEAALESGLEHEAYEALDEARRLASDTPDLETLRARVRERSRAGPVQETAREPVRRPVPLALAVGLSVIAVALGISAVQGGLFTPRGADEPRLSSTVTGQAALPERTAAPAGEVRAALTMTPAGIHSATTTAPVGGTGVTALSRNSEMTAPPVTEVMPSPSATLGTAGLVLATDTPSSSIASGVPAAPPLPDPPPPDLPRTGTGAPLEVLAASLPSTSPAPPEAPSAPPTPKAPEPMEPRIRAVLSQYASAFGALDASAARAVWPTVDEHALARAFEGLASQRISLGSCAITIDGDRATAACSGTATWTPRVGGAPRTASRRWTFALENAAGSWQIVRAEAR
jgi:hypothetical protein